MRPVTIILLIIGIIFLSSCSIDDNFVSIEDIDYSSIEHSLILSGQYLLNNQNGDGSLEYLYYPSEERFSTNNNMIRQFMSTIALSEVSKYSNNMIYENAFDNNLKYNLENYYFEDNNIGYVFFNNKSKLGAAAFAIISILESEKYEEELANLINLVELLHNETDGSFRTFYIPEDRNDNQYFYPGEAMLALMMLYEKTGDEKYIDMVKKPFSYYPSYYREKMNPAFIPWNTQALFHLYQETGNETYVDYIFEINDWLLAIQNKKCAEPKHLGRFYDPNFKQYGSPHASSTAVYVEGLTYAYSLAKELGDSNRMENYREAILLGARSLIELQFKEEDIIERDDAEIVLGGIRTSTSRDEIRVDNNQHTIMAFLAILNFLGEDEIKEFVSSHPEYYCS